MITDIHNCHQKGKGHKNKVVNQL